MNMKLVLFTFLLASISEVVFGHVQRNIRKGCPALEEIPKCSCSESTKGLSVICKDFQSDEDLQSHLKCLQGYLLTKLQVNKYTASSISTDLWKGQEIEDLSLAFVEVDDASFRPGKRHFQGLENSLRTLEIRNSFRNGHRPLLNLQLDHLSNLNHVILEDNSIPEVGNDWFTSGPKELSTLIFERNGIEELGDQALSSLSNLRLLAVAGNHLHSISRTMFPNSANLLMTLDLAYNKIRTLPKDIFSGMPSLQDVNLDYNLIHVIQQDTWGPKSSQITSLRLEGNALECDKSMQWICGTPLKNAYGKCSSPLQNRGQTLQQFCNH